MELVLEDIWLVWNYSYRILDKFGTVLKGYMISLELVLNDIDYFELVLKDVWLVWNLS